MSEVSGLDYDIFISYSHNDNYPLSGKQGWVDQFHNTLENWLLRRRGLKNLTIWRDKELQGNTRFDAAIENKIKSCALFFVLHSVNYQQSEYCKKELEIFIQGNNQGLGGINVGEQSRVFHILLNNFPFASWPEKLAGTSGFVMHDADNEQSLGDFTAPNRDTFQEQLRHIVDASEAIIKTMAKASINQQVLTQDKSSQEHAKQVYSDSSQSDKNGDELTIFIADTADSQRAFRKRLVADLKERGNHVIAVMPPPYPYDEHQQRVKSTLQQAHLSIHLLGEYPGSDIQDHQQSSYPRAQLDMALNYADEQFIWLPPDLDTASIDDPEHRDWLLQLEQGERRDQQYQFIRNNEAAFTNIILATIETQKQEHQIEVIEPSFLIDTHQKDQQYAYQLAGLMASQGLNVEFNKESADPIESMNLFEQSVAQVPNLIITFGQVSPKWLAGRIRRAVKIFASQFEQETTLQLENIWIFLTPDNQGPDSLPTLPPLIPVHVLDSSGAKALNTELVESLVSGAAP